MDLQLLNKVAVVTGSTAGIGFAIAEALAREGASVVVNGRTEQRVSDAMTSFGPRAFGASWKVSPQMSEQQRERGSLRAAFQTRTSW